MGVRVGSKEKKKRCGSISFKKKKKEPLRLRKDSPRAPVAERRKNSVTLLNRKKKKDLLEQKVQLSGEKGGRNAKRRISHGNVAGIKRVSK